MSIELAPAWDPGRLRQEFLAHFAQGWRQAAPQGKQHCSPQVSRVLQQTSACHAMYQVLHVVHPAVGGIIPGQLAAQVGQPRDDATQPIQGLGVVRRRPCHHSLRDLD